MPLPRRRPHLCLSGATPRNWVHCCTQLAHSTLDRPDFDLELEGVPEDWLGVQLGAPDTRLPKRTTRSSRKGRYQPVGPRAQMTRPQGPDAAQQ